LRRLAVGLVRRLRLEYDTAKLDPSVHSWKQVPATVHPLPEVVPQPSTPPKRVMP
jgi:hypothetical protein